MQKLQVNTKFVNNLQPEWSKFVTDVKLAKDMHESSFDQLYAYLMKHDVHANEVRMMRERFLDPLALVAISNIAPRYYNNHQPQYNSSQYHQQLSPIAQQFYTSFPQPQPYEALVHQKSYSAPVVHQAPVVHEQPYQAPAPQQQSPAVFPLYSHNIQTTSKPLLPSTGVNSSTHASGLKPKGNTRNNRISRTSSSNQKNKKVENHPRNVKTSLNKKNRVSICNASTKHAILNANFKFVCSISNECLFNACHDMCVVDYLNVVNSRTCAKSGKSNKKNEWKPTGKVFTNVGHKWLPTGRTFIIDGTKCPLTRITSITVVPPKKPCQTKEIQKTLPRKESQGKPNATKNVRSSSKSKIVESRISNNSEPNKNWGYNVYNSLSSSRVQRRPYKSSSSTWTRVTPST
ncbi:hypothetical protein Tco_1228531 [Tanacetum coccineum]